MATAPSLARLLADPAASQRELLRRILAMQADTEEGRSHGFGEIRDPDAYRARVPVRTWSDIEPQIERMTRGERGVLVSEPVLYFGETGGTTGPRKLVPITRSSARALGDHYRAWRSALLSRFPGLGANDLLHMINHSPSGRTPAGIPVGSLARLRAAEGRMSNGWFPEAVFDIADRESRYYTVLRMALEVSLAGVIAINPSTLVILAHRLAQHADALIDDLAAGRLADWVRCDAPVRAALERILRPQPERARALAGARAEHGRLRPADAWPQLRCLVCWKHGHVGFFVDQLPEHYGELPVFGLGHMATEGAFSLPLHEQDPGCVPSVGATFLEYLPEGTARGEHPETRLVHELEPGRRYRLIITTLGGLHRYDMNDIVEVAGWRDQVPLLRFVEKGDRMLSITGEKVGEEHVARAFGRAAASLGLTLAGGSVTVELRSIPSYMFAYEGAPASVATALAEACDAALREINMEYEFHRGRGALGAPVGLCLPAGTYAAWRARRVEQGTAEAQVKHPWTFCSRQALEEELGSSR